MQQAGREALCVEVAEAESREGEYGDGSGSEECTEAEDISEVVGGGLDGQVRGGEEPGDGEGKQATGEGEEVDPVEEITVGAGVMDNLHRVIGDGAEDDTGKERGEAAGD